MCNGGGILSLQVSLDASVVLVSHIFSIEMVENHNKFSIGRQLGPSTTPDVSSNTAPCSKVTPLEKIRAATSGPLTSSPIECVPPPPSSADATGHNRPHTVLQGTITALKLIQQIVGLSPVPGLQSLVVVVLNISEVVNVSCNASRM